MNLMIKKARTFACDFETTVFENQSYTEVWASASVELFSDEPPKIFGSIDEQFDYFISLKCNINAYYHNLKFDGSFWIPFLLFKLKYKQAYKELDSTGLHYEWLKDKDMPNNSFKYTISAMGQWYTITIKKGGYLIQIKDSLKLLPFSLKRIGQSFKTKHQKLEMEYKGFRYSGCNITTEEKEYIANDVYVLKEALEIMFNEGHNKLTIGSCCLSEFKKTHDKIDYENFFPDLTQIELEPKHTYPNVDRWIRKSYKGGWCYLVKGKENKIYEKGTTADVNSLYPSMMSSESGNKYPYGKPTFWFGNYIPDEALKENRYFFIRIKTRFYIKDGYLPFIQIKGDLRYKGTEALETSDIYDGDIRCSHYTDEHGNKKPITVELTLTQTDYYLMLEHYELVDFEIIDGCYFFSTMGLFDEYIEKYKQQKIVSKGALRELAKLFLNNLYGKMASSSDSSFKVAIPKEDGTIGFIGVTANDKKVGYIAVGSAITSYARNFTIRAAQKNYHGVNNRGFIYADTDSIHCDLNPEEITGIKVHDKNFCCWKLESCWDIGIFVRQKTYIEHVTHEDLQPIETPFYNVKCAGMPQRCKDLFVMSMSQNYTKEQFNKLPDEHKEFVKTKRTLSDFKRGLVVPGKLLPKRIQGGIILKDTSYEMRL